MFSGWSHVRQQHVMLPISNSPKLFLITAFKNEKQHPACSSDCPKLFTYGPVSLRNGVLCVFLWMCECVFVSLSVCPPLFVRKAVTSWDRTHIFLLHLISFGLAFRVTHTDTHTHTHTHTHTTHTHLDLGMINHSVVQLQSHQWLDDCYCICVSVFLSPTHMHRHTHTE